MTHKGIVGTTTLMVLGWTVFVLGIATLFFNPLVGALLAIAGAVQVSGGMITEALNGKREAFAVLPNSRDEDITASGLQPHAAILRPGERPRQGHSPS